MKAEGTPLSLVFPSLTGGVNWGGVAVEPTRVYIFVNSKDEATVGWTVPNPRYGGPIATAGGLVFIGATSDQKLRAFDSRTGAALWSYALPYDITAIPISYEGNDGRQYLAVTAARGASGPPGDEGLFVFALAE